jgi:cation:H+ antiporter
LWFLLGLGALVIGAEVLVRGASGLARSLGVSPLVVGLTVVAFGTSAPELSISLLSLLKGQADLSVGNVIGSNIANILLILGSSALLAPLVVSKQLVRFDVPIMIAASLLVLFLSWNGRLDRGEGALLVVALILYTTVLIWIQKKKDERDDETREESALGKGLTRVVVYIAFVLVGLVLLVKGAEWLVDSATTFARWLGVSDLVIGLTVVAGGTSLPELATSVIAAIRGERDIAIGNVVGSCIMNLLMVLGVASLVAPNGIELNPALFSFDLPVMIAVAVACLPIFFTDHLIARWEGALFLGYYIAYVTYLVMSASHHDSLPLFNGIMLAFVIPLTVITLAVLTIRAWRKQKGSSK